MCYVGTIRIAGADVDRPSVCRLGHDVPAKMLVEGRNGVVICSCIGVVIDAL